MHQDLRGFTPAPSLRTPAPALRTPDLYSPPVGNWPSFDPNTIIYGTTVQVGRELARLQKFILQFQTVREVEGEVVSEQVYRAKLNELEYSEQTVVFEVEGRHIREFDRELYLQFVYYPAEMIAIADQVLKGLYSRYFLEPETDAYSRTVKQSRMEGLMLGLRRLHEDEEVCIRQLGPNQIGRMVAIRAIVIRVSDVFPELKRAWFRCEFCYDELGVALCNAKVQQPQTCRVCHSRNSMQIMHNHCSFTDKQYIKFQELPELVTEGESPSALTAIAYDSNVDGMRSGDRVELIGIYRTQAAKIDKSLGTVRTIFNTFLDLVSFSVLEENRFGVVKNSGFTDSERTSFLKFATDENVINNLVKSFAPSIFGHAVVKKGILAQLFGGTKKKLPNGGTTRADLNVCLVGDPSTAKSQLLQQVHRLAPRSVYTSGRGSSAVGLTANVRRDPQTREFVLQSGALVLADQGICCIDEFDKMDQNSRTILLEAMEQQTISIAKAGIVCQLNSRTAILAAANPIDSKYDVKKSIIHNINLPPSLLSRFDLLYILLDIANEADDTRLARHILDFYVNGCKKIEEGPLNLQKLMRYITYARNYIFPTLTAAAGVKLANAYRSLRAIGLSNKTISATPRQLESLIRMSEAFARMRLSSEVSEEDVEEAVTLMEKATLASATNPETGIVDLDIITTGRSSTVKKRIEEVAHKIREFLFANESKYRKQNNLQKMMEEFALFENNRKLGASREEMLSAMEVLQSDELLVMYGQSKNNPNFKLQCSTEE